MTKDRDRALYLRMLEQRICDQVAVVLNLEASERRTFVPDIAALIRERRSILLEHLDHAEVE